MARPKTRTQTLYRLPGVPPTVDGMFDALIGEQLDEISADLKTIQIDGAPALWVAGQTQRPVASWCDDASVTTGLRIVYGDQRSAGLLMLAVDGATYALGYGDGHRLIPDELKEPRFGLRFAVRRLNPEQVQDLVRRFPGTRGRTDVTVVPAGSPIWAFGLQEHAEIIGRLGGRSRDLAITFSGSDKRPVRVEGAVGLTMRFAVGPADLISDIREIARVCAEESPHPALEFVDYIHPIREVATRAELEAEFGKILRGSDTSAAVVPVVPTALVNEFRYARSFRVKIGGASPRLVSELEAGLFLRRTRLQIPGQEVSALRDGNVRMFADDEGGGFIGGGSAIKWLEANVSLGAHRFFLLDGEWYEIDAHYLEIHHAQVSRLLGTQPSLDLPTWDTTWAEGDYNDWVPLCRKGYVCLDRRVLRGGLHQRSGVEVCDLLAPGDELVHVKRAHGSAPLSHLFSQGLVAVQALLHSADVRTRFVAAVRHYGNGRTVPEDFTPKKIVYAILLKDGERLTPDTLFPFSQVTLAHTARTLEAMGVSVEVIGIDAAVGQVRKSALMAASTRP